MKTRAKDDRHGHEKEGGLLRDRRLREVAWKDLQRLSRGEVLWEIVLPLPWLAGSLACAAYGWYVSALVLSFFFYLAGLRVVHGAFHHAVGLPRWGDKAMLVLWSALMLGSMHAVRANHLRHHQDCLGPHDFEGKSARMAWWQALLYGPIYPFAGIAHAFRLARPRERRWMTAELGINAVLIAGAFLWPALPLLTYHVTAMLIGQGLSAFFCIWTVHHGCEATGLFSRTARGRWLNAVTFNMFLHTEHHLFPAVPTCRLGNLAERVDNAMPEVRSRQVL